jgi:hypothetical protein
VNELDYWPNLEYRICREFAGMVDRGLRYLWCDGFIPQQYLLSDPTPRIEGFAWICKGQDQERWTFTLVLPRPVVSLEDIDWSSLIPPEEVTRWLALDDVGKRIQIEPAAAVPGPAR